MRRFFTSRLFRACVCLILVCCVLVLNSPIQVNAAAGGLVAAEIVKASTVSCNPYVVAGACLIALGVWAAAESGVFERLSGHISLRMLEQKLTNNDGAIEVLQTVNAAGETTFYVPGDVLEFVRSEVIGSEFLAYTSTVLTEAQIDIVSGIVSRWCVAYENYAPHIAFAPRASGSFDLLISRWPITMSGLTAYSYSSPTQKNVFNHYTLYTDSYKSDPLGLRTYVILENLPLAVSSSVRFCTDYNLSLGYIPDFYIDGTSALEWAPEYANRQLRVINTGGGNNPDGGGDGDPNWKWYMPLALGSMAALLTQVQSDQWSGVTPDEFPEYDTIQEFEILDKPEIDNFAYIEIQPVTNPGVNPDTGSGTDPDSGSESDPEKESVPLPGVIPGINPGTGTDPGTDPGTNPGTGTDPGTNPGTNPGTGTDPGGGSGSEGNSGSSTPPESMQPFMLDLKDFFPFCIPFDLYKFFSLLCAEPEAPVFTWVVQDLGGNSYPITVDLSKWDNFAALFRKLQLFVFIIGLAMSSRKFIKW